MNLPAYTPALYFGIGVIVGVFGILGYALWLAKRDAPPAPKHSRKWDKVSTLEFHYDYDIRARAHGTYADLMSELFIYLSKQLKDDENFRKNGQPHDCVYTVVIDGKARFTQRPATEPLHGVAAEGFPRT